MGPAGGRGGLAPGEQQPGPLRRDGVEQAGHGRARRGPPGLFHRLPGPARVTAGLPDPRQRGQAGGQRLGEVELPAQREAPGEMPEGRVEFVPLVGHLGQAHVPDARGGQGRPSGRRGDLERLLVGAGRGVQAAPGPLDLAEVVVGPGGDDELARRPPLGDARRQQALGLREPAARPLGSGQLPPSRGVEHRFALAELGQGPRRERGRRLGVAAEHGEVGTPERDRRGDVRQQAGGLAG